MSSWLFSAKDLLDEPDPGPVEVGRDLIVDGTLTGVKSDAGRPPRATRCSTWPSLSLPGGLRSGGSRIPKPGPVMFVIEESGWQALAGWTRATRGRGIPHDELYDLPIDQPAGQADDAEWQAKLIDAGRTIRPRLIVFDPLA